MTVFIELETDPFAEVFASEHGEAAKSYMPKPVRRPLRGTQLKPDTYSYIRIVDSEGRTIPLVDAGGEGISESGYMATTDHYTNFLIQGVQLQRMEKQQIIETFGSDYIYFYGAAPRIYTISALLVNSLDFNWFNEFWYNYENYLRGTKLVERGARAYIYNDDLLWECYILGVSATKDAGNLQAVPVQLSVLVMEEAIVSNVGDPAFPNQPGVDSSQLQNMESYDRLLAQYNDNRNIYWDQARTSSFLKDLYTILTTGELLYSTKAMHNPLVPLRSNIRDNHDEYIGAAMPTDIYFDESDLSRMRLLHTIRDFYELSQAMLGWANQMGSMMGNPAAFASFAGLAMATAGVIAVPGTLL